MKQQIRLILIVLLMAGIVSAATVGPAPRTYVEDRAGVLDGDTKTRVIGLLQELEQKTLARVVVLTVATTDGMDINQYAFERGDQWKFGANRKGASVLIVVAIQDRKYKFEVGYDYEGVLPDGKVGQIGREYLVPHFKAGRYGQGIFESTAMVAQFIAEDKRVALTGMPKLKPMRRGMGRAPCAGAPFLLIFILLMLSSGRRGRSGLFWGVMLGSMLGGGYRGGGGGFGGGGFGGFGGGGGGGFGGGGAGGSW